MDPNKVYSEMADSHENLKRGMVWCRTCGKSMQVDSAHCLRHGWPKCCGCTMSLDAPITKETPNG